MAGDTRIQVSVLILTLNEADNIERCIAALDWCDDVVVLDSFSTDETAEKARKLGARVFERKFDNFAGQRNFALKNLEFKHEWILHLDADEIVTDELRDEISGVISSEEFDAYRIASKLIFNGTWLRFSGMYPVYQVRLGKKNVLQFKQTGHGQQETMPSEAVGTLTNPYLHHGFSKGISDWIERHNRYSGDEAVQNMAGTGVMFTDLFDKDRTVRRRALKTLSVNLPFRPLLRFFYMYVYRLGFIDGRAGWNYCCLVATYEYWIVLKEREIYRRRKKL